MKGEIIFFLVELRASFFFIIAPHTLLALTRVIKITLYHTSNVHLKKGIV